MLRNVVRNAFLKTDMGCSMCAVVDVMNELPGGEVPAVSQEMIITCTNEPPAGEVVHVSSHEMDVTKLLDHWLITWRQCQ